MTETRPHLVPRCVHSVRHRTVTESHFRNVTDILEREESGIGRGDEETESG